MQNQVIDRGWGGIRLVVEATRFVNTDYIVLYNVSRETNNYKKHNAWLQNKQGKRATQAYAYEVIICVVNS